jgi:hypothetical protein
MSTRTKKNIRSALTRKGGEMKDQSNTDNKLRLIDIIMIALCLIGAAGSLSMFWFGLFSPNSSNNEKPAGILTMKNNVVQRRPEDRVLWGRLALNSPVYFGDLILVADSSSAMINIDDNYINLNENTLIRLQRRQDNKGLIQIDLEEGHIEIHPDKQNTSGKQSAVPVIFAGGSTVTARAGTTLGVEARKDGVVDVQIIEGSAVMTAGNERITNFSSKELSAGTKFTIDAEGSERLVPGAVVTLPRSNAHFLKNTHEPLSVEFAWNRINLDPQRTLRLEIAANQNFNRIAFSADGLHETAKAALNAGRWYWRLRLDSATLASGQLIVADATGPQPVSPPKETVYRYRDKPPLVRFQWSERKEAASYLLEISETQDFSANTISRQVNGLFFIETNLKQGAWYWRVLPVFPNTYEGSAAHSSVSAFRIEQQSGMIAERVVEPPDTIIEPEPVTQPEPEVQARPAAARAASAELPTPGNRRPTNGQRIGVEELRTQRNIVFSWSAVQGANGYIVTIYQETNGRRQKITGTDQPISRTSWTLDNLTLLARGNFIWQVEAVYSSGGRITRRSNPGENTFMIDIPLPGQVRSERPSIME